MIPLVSPCMIAKLQWSNGVGRRRRSNKTKNVSPTSLVILVSMFAASWNATAPRICLEFLEPHAWEECVHYFRFPMKREREREREKKKKKNMSTIFDSQCRKEEEKTRKERERERRRRRRRICPLFSIPNAEKKSKKHGERERGREKTRENTKRLRRRSKIKNWGERGSNSRPQDFSQL